MREKNNQYAFYVHPSANKIQIRDAVQTVFKVKVEKVRISYVKGKMKRMGAHAAPRPDRKKAVVTLKKGDKIALFEGV